MAQPPQQGPGLGALAMKGAALTIKVALNMALNNRSIVEHIASQAYTDETGGRWDKLSPGDKALWSARVQSVIRAVSGVVGL